MVCRAEKAHTPDSAVETKRLISFATTASAEAQSQGAQFSRWQKAQLLREKID